MRVLLTGVGCPGAHALISNLKLQDESIFILGTNANEQAIGRWLCDDFAVVPWAYEKNYVDSILNWLNTDLFIFKRKPKNVGIRDIDGICI